MSKKIVVFGNLPIATKIARWVEARNDCELEGVVLTKKEPHNNDPWVDVPCLREHAERNGIRIIDLAELPQRYKDGELDLGLTCRFSSILKPAVISRFRIGVINMHGGLLPEFAGLYSCNHTLLNGSKIGGGTLHYIDEGIDTGNIIKRCEFPIEEDDTGFTVFQKTQLALYQGMIDIIPKVLRGDQEAIPISNLVDEAHPWRYFDSQSLEGKKLVDFDAMDDEEVLRRVRAFDFPGYEPAYFETCGRRIYMRMS